MPFAFNYAARSDVGMVRSKNEDSGYAGPHLLAMADGTTVLLSTPEADEQQSRAWRLYRRFGFVDVLRHFIFPGDEREFAILGRGLPVSERPVQDAPGIVGI